MFWQWELSRERSSAYLLAQMMMQIYGVPPSGLVVDTGKHSARRIAPGDTRRLLTRMRTPPHFPQPNLPLSGAAKDKNGAKGQERTTQDSARALHSGNRRGEAPEIAITADLGSLAGYMRPARDLR